MTQRWKRSYKNWKMELENGGFHHMSFSMAMYFFVELLV